MPSCEIVDLAVNFRISDHWVVRAAVANLLGNEHYEHFGGALLGRRILASATFSW